MLEKALKEFDEKFPISIDYFQPNEVLESDTGVMIEIENNARWKRALAKNEEIKSFLTSFYKQILTEEIKRTENWFDDEKFGDITQNMVEIAEGKRNIDEWNDNMNALVKFISSLLSSRKSELEKLNKIK